MKNNMINGGLKLLIALSMLPAPFFSQGAFAKGAPAPKGKGKGKSKCEPLNACKSAYDAWQLQQKKQGGVEAPAGGLSAAGGAVAKAGTEAAAIATPAKQACEEAKPRCEEEKNKSQGKTCKDEDCEAIAGMFGMAGQGVDGGNAAAAGGAKTQSAAGGGDGAMMGALLGAAIGAGAMLMMQKKKEEEEAKAKEAAAAAAAAAQYNGALQANGSIDCSKPDAMLYRDCGPKMEARCMTILDDPTCQQFSARYCGGAPPIGGANATLLAQPQTPPGVQFAVNPATLMGTPGEGMGSQYCKGVMGWNYCKAPGRASCPSCLQIQRNQSPVCAQNPALCLAQNSIAEIERAKTTCPTDPAFADPTFTAGGASQLPFGGGAPAGLPAVVLPQSTLSSGNGSGAGSSASGGGISTQSASFAAQQANGGNREGYANNGNSHAAYGGGGSGSGGGGSAGSNFAPASAGGGREFASAGGTRAPGTGPSSEIEGQYGPSLFNTSSQVIRRRCQSGRLNNCP